MVLSNIKKYLKDKNYAIDIFENGIYIYNFKTINYISETLLIIIFSNFTVKIKGNNFCVRKMLEKEALFNGFIESVIFEYE